MFVKFGGDLGENIHYSRKNEWKFSDLKCTRLILIIKKSGKITIFNVPRIYVPRIF